MSEARTPVVWNIIEAVVMTGSFSSMPPSMKMFSENGGNASGAALVARAIFHASMCANWPVRLWKMTGDMRLKLNDGMTNFPFMSDTFPGSIVFKADSMPSAVYFGVNGSSLFLSDVVKNLCMLSLKSLLSSCGSPYLAR